MSIHHLCVLGQLANSTWFWYKRHSTPIIISSRRGRSDCHSYAIHYFHSQGRIKFEWIILERRLNAISMEHLCTQLNRFQRSQVYSSLKTAKNTLKHNRLHVHKAIGSNRNVLKRRKICESQVSEWATLQRKLLCKTERAQPFGSDSEGLKLVTAYAHTPVATPPDTWNDV